jgi:hypothetical protein
MGFSRHDAELVPIGGRFGASAGKLWFVPGFKEDLNLDGTHVLGMPLAKMPDKSFNPIHASLLSADATVLQANPRPDLLKKPGCRHQLGK